jgi:hypothetical protein
MKLFWNESIRNVSFKILDLMGQDSAQNFYLSNAALKVVRQLTEPNARPTRVSREDEKMPIENDFSANVCTQQMADEMLAKLVREQDTNLYVDCEQSSDTVQQHKTKPKLVTSTAAYVPSSDVCVSTIPVERFMFFLR